ncbi:MAG: SDR family NAD(P)-dependent oxidoreductase [Opitutaceae bacterium]|nr:SDR family NAD(P)-dependent oxidoreductase [Opitutaceae bacterium]
MSHKLCVIVGYGPGIGHSLAKAFAHEGHTLALISRIPGKHESLRQSLGAAAHGFAADAGDAASLQTAFASIRGQLGDPSVLIYNAYSSHPGKPTTLNVDGLMDDFRINVAGALVATMEVLPAMKASRQGTIIFTGGGLALQPWAEQASLSIGKAGLRSLAFTLAQELQGTNIQVGTVTICGMVKPGTHFDPDKIAASFIGLHYSSCKPHNVEVVYH